VVMPVLSRSMPHAQMMGMNADCGMDMSHANGHADHHHGMPGDPDDPTAHCGYCVLLTHTPVVAMGIALLLAPADVPTLSPPAIQPRSVASVPLLSAPPRGPPLLANG
jgi:hypothetical protein